MLFIYDTNHFNVLTHNLYSCSLATDTVANHVYSLQSIAEWVERVNQSVHLCYIKLCVNPQVHMGKSYAEYLIVNDYLLLLETIYSIGQTFWVTHDRVASVASTCAGMVDMA